MLVDSEFTLYADSYSSFLTDWAIIVLVIGTVPLEKKPRMNASAEMTNTDGDSASMMSEMNMDTSQHMKSLSCPIRSVSRPMITFPDRLPMKNMDVNEPMNAASMPRNVRRKGMNMKREEFAKAYRRLDALASMNVLFFRSAASIFFFPFSACP